MEISEILRLTGKKVYCGKIFVQLNLIVTDGGSGGGGGGGGGDSDNDDDDDDGDEDIFKSH